MRRFAHPPMTILGINAYHGDAAAVLLRDGQLVAACEEERFGRVKHCAGFPGEAVRSCLDIAGIDGAEVDHIAVSRNPRAHFLRKASYALCRAPSRQLLLDRWRNRRRVTDIAGSLASVLRVPSERVRSRLHWVEHHPAHLASAYFVSPFERAAVCAIDGFGDFVSTSWAAGSGGRLRRMGRIYFPHSLGLFYLAVTQHLGFRRYGDEYKVMGLAAYGTPDFAGRLEPLVSLDDDGAFRLDLSYFRHWSEGVEMNWQVGEPSIGLVFTRRLEDLLGPAREPDEPVTARHQAIAASLQCVFERAVMHVLWGVHRRTGLDRLCLAGGCAMNSVANGRIRERTPFTEVFVQPAAADNGTALGAAAYVAHQTLGLPRSFVMEHGYWGPAFSADEVTRDLEVRRSEMEARDCRPRPLPDDEAVCAWTAERIAAGFVVGWFQGRMEWGARALGNRSILADPRRADMRAILNARVKFRESFRPFAPAVLEESVDEYFVGAAPDPFMLHVYRVRPEKRAVIPAVTHVDGSGRLQTVTRRGNPLFWQLIRTFQQRTGVPLVLNTSFNEQEPIVCTPAQALDCFLRTDMDALVLGRTVLEKTASAGTSARPPAVEEAA